MKNNIKLGILVGLVILITGVVVFAGDLGVLQAETKNKAEATIGYVDVMEVFTNHPQTALAKEELNNLASEVQKQLEVELKDKTQEERKKIVEDYQNQLAQREQELMDEVIRSIDDTIREVAAELGLKVVLDKQNVIYGGQDLTQQVQERILAKANN